MAALKNEIAAHERVASVEPRHEVGEAVSVDIARQVGVAVDDVVAELRIVSLPDVPLIKLMSAPTRGP